MAEASYSTTMGEDAIYTYLSFDGELAYIGAVVSLKEAIELVDYCLSKIVWKPNA